ncbi:MAG: efflux RND transporter periplasmic adaptor subunit [Candidatus Latescibacteria bacterium]|nr:efflux RND transporter periplasmic adaptor subunit [Candidatus Latescibacterota bacterium]NIO57308.1 efflux RND transporter periplasmic adaptor subunit [Candidatus Latescibacterota bacterium]
MKPRYSAFTAYLVGAGLALFAGSCGSGGSIDNQADQPIPGVEAVQARYGTLPLTQRLSGVVRATNQVAIYPEISAVITEVLVRNGDAVQKGQPMVRLRDKEFRDRLKQATASYQIAVAQARQAEARLKEAQSELKRIQRLAEQEMVSTSQLETAETRAALAEADVDLARARVEQAQANMAEQEENLSQTIVRAPVAGSVGDRNAEVGMLVDNNTQLFTLGQLDNMYVQVVITDKMLTFIEEGQPAEVFSTSFSSGPISATLARISPFLHPVTHSTDGEIDVANPEGLLKPGMFVTVDIFYGESEEATLVPLSSLYEHPATGVTGVYVTEASLDREPVAALNDEPSISFSRPVTFKFVPVRIIAKGRMEAGILGVEPGMWVVTLGQNLLGGEAADARVRPVDWGWVEKLQKLQREDLMQDVIERKSSL